MTEDERPQGLVPGSGRRIEPRAFQQMISLRLDGGLVAALRAHAAEVGRSLSDVLREAAIRYLRDVQSEHEVTVRWTVINGTRSASPDSREYETVLPPAGVVRASA